VQSVCKQAPARSIGNTLGRAAYRLANFAPLATHDCRKASRLDGK
jgi:hypothetical protein